MQNSSRSCYEITWHYKDTILGQLSCKHLARKVKDYQSVCVHVDLRVIDINAYTVFKNGNPNIKIWGKKFKKQSLTCRDFVYVDASKDCRDFPKVNNLKKVLL